LSFPRVWFQVVNSFFNLHSSRLSAWAWVMLAKRHWNPSAPQSSPSGHVDGLGRLGWPAAAAIRSVGTKVLPYWMIMTYCCTLSGRAVPETGGHELLHQLAPKRTALVGRLMGIVVPGDITGN